MQSVPNYLFKKSLRENVTKARSQFGQELKELRSPQHSAANLAAAFALGTMLSFIPVPLLDSMLVALIVTRFKQVNRASLFMARLLWNDLVVFPFYGPGYRIGAALLKPFISANPPLPGWETTARSLLSLTLGSVILAVGLAAAGYSLFLLGITLYRSNRVMDFKISH